MVFQIEMYDKVGKFEQLRMTDYENYQEEDLIIFGGWEYYIANIIVNEDDNTKTVKAHRTSIRAKK